MRRFPALVVKDISGNNAGNKISLPRVVPGVLCIGVSIRNTARDHFAVNGASCAEFDEAMMRTAFNDNEK